MRRILNYTVNFDKEVCTSGCTCEHILSQKKIENYVQQCIFMSQKTLFLGMKEISSMRIIVTIKKIPKLVLLFVVY